MSKQAFGEMLERFLNGDIEAYEFDDFTSVKFSDSELEAYRKEVVSLRERYPANDASQYTSDFGLERLREIAFELLS